jgi:hypothetical protein
MAPTNIIEKKAEEFGINIADPEGLGRLRVCKRMLEGLYGQLDDSHIKVIVALNMIEKELLAIRREFDSMKRASKSVVFIQNRYVVSFDKIAGHVRTAYTCIVAAYMVNENGADINAHKEISQSLMECQDAIYNALQEFLIH